MINTCNSIRHVGYLQRTEKEKKITCSATLSELSETVEQGDEAPKPPPEHVIDPAVTIEAIPENCDAEMVTSPEVVSICVGTQRYP